MIDGHGGGVVLQCLGCHADALAVFSSGLSQDPKSLQLLAGLVEAAVKLPPKGRGGKLGVESVIDGVGVGLHYSVWDISVWGVMLMR